MEELTREEGRETPPARKKLRKPRLGKKEKRLLLVLILAAAAAFAAVKLLKGQESQAVVAYQETAVEQRDITRSLSSSGTLEPADSYTVKTLASAEILSDTFEEGDIVEEGQLLYTLDSSDASTSQTQAQNSYSQAQKSYNQAVEAKYPTADISGTVSEVYVRDGDSVSNGTQICRIVGDNNIYMDFSFSYASSADFYAGQPATVFISGFDGSISGTVEQVSQSSTASGNAAGSGRELITVRVMLYFAATFSPKARASGVLKPIRETYMQPSRAPSASLASWAESQPSWPISTQSMPISRACLAKVAILA